MTQTHVNMTTTPAGRRIIVMGVSGSGKSSIGDMVGHALGIPYIDGDQYHPQTNLDKMTHGQPLSDEDRAGWLATIARLIHQSREQEDSVLIGCSALKRKYRDQLRAADPDLVFLFLDGGFDEILARMKCRRHFFSANMLASQFEALEVPGPDEQVIRVDINADISDVVEQATDDLRAYLSGG